MTPAIHNLQPETRKPQSLRYAPASSWLRVEEPAPEPLNESELSWIWAGQRYPAGALQMVDGRRLRVVSPGRPGGGSGPDYLDAVLEIDGANVQGDVELHVRASGFRAHGHDVDPAYDGVALHVVFRADDGASTRLRCGDEAPVAAFAPWLEGRASEMQGWLSAEATWREPCRDAAWRLGGDGVRSVLREAGLRRFESKVETMRDAVATVGEEEAVWRLVFDVLGTGGDREGFRHLSVAFPVSLARAVLATGNRDQDGVRVLGAALSHMAGLAAAPFGLGLELAPPIRPAIAGGGRPANRPDRRLAGIAALFGRSDGRLANWARAMVRDAGSVKALVAGWQVSRDGQALIGAGKARELALNVGLVLAAMEPERGERAGSLLAGMPAAPVYGKTAFLELNLRDVAETRPVGNALEQQGLLAFVSQWGRCPLS